MRVLVAEDDPGLRSMLVMVLDEVFEGLAFQQAANGDEAFDTYGWFKPDLILSDFQMPPGADGGEMILRIRRFERQAGRARCPAILLSADLNLCPIGAYKEFSFGISKLDDHMRKKLAVAVKDLLKL